jgi:hypothetical protein
MSVYSSPSVCAAGHTVSVRLGSMPRLVLTSSGRQSVIEQLDGKVQLRRPSRQAARACTLLSERTTETCGGRTYPRPQDVLRIFAQRGDLDEVPLGGSD